MQNQSHKSTIEPSICNIANTKQIYGIKFSKNVIPVIKKAVKRTPANRESEEEVISEKFPKFKPLYREVQADSQGRKNKKKMELDSH